MDKANIDQYPEIPVKRQLGEAYPIWIETHKSLFQSFEDFIDHALKYDPECDKLKKDFCK
ncbi:hypothetical protein [Coprobacter sp.]|uniref:hypothetical protein n=1 Tax=Coprobacter sp. TaxID=1941478 RepID=UPI003AB8BC8D